MSEGEAGDGEIERFWRLASFRAKLTTLPGYLPASSLELVVPPAWSFGREDPATADRLLALVLDGTKTATAGAYDEYVAAGEQIPEVGTLSILLDGAGHPRALIAASRVDVVPFEEVDAEHARLEGEGDLSLAHWREVHQAFFAEALEGPFDPRMLVVAERFDVLFSQ